MAAAHDAQVPTAVHACNKRAQLDRHSQLLLPRCEKDAVKMIVCPIAKSSCTNGSRKQTDSRQKKIVNSATITLMLMLMPDNDLEDVARKHLASARFKMSSSDAEQPMCRMTLQQN